MRNTALLLIGLFIFHTADCQKKDLPKNIRQIEDSIVEEGRKLYQLEMASNLGLETFSEQLKTLADSTGGYFSYKEGKIYKCVFYNDQYDAQILASVSFDSSFKKKRNVDTIVRPMSNKEKDLLAIRRRAVDDMKRDTSFYKLYTNVSTSILPLVDHNVKKVFVLTRSDDPGSVIFGNDYLYEFDANNYLSSRKLLHTNLVAMELPSKNAPIDESIDKVSHVHKDETSEYITSTDVCTLLLTQNNSNWKHHVVKSEDFVSIYDFDTNELQTVTKKKWNKYNKEDVQEKQTSAPIKSTASAAGPNEKKSYTTTLEAQFPPQQ